MTEPLVFVPDMMCDARIFMSQINAFSRERAVMVAPVTQGERIEEIASSILDQMPRKAAVFGLGLGGAIAMELLRRAPDRLSRIALAGAPALPEAPADAALRDPQIARARAGRLDEVIQEIWRPEHLAQGPQRIKIASYMHGMARDLGPDVFARQSRALQRRRDQQGTLRKCRVPALVLCGAEDPITPIKRAEFLAGLIPYAELKVIDGAGRMPPLEKPAATTQALQNWLALPMVLR